MTALEKILKKAVYKNGCFQAPIVADQCQAKKDPTFVLGYGKSMLKNPEPSIWVREKEDFLGQVSLNGKQVSRFILADPKFYLILDTSIVRLFEKNDIVLPVTSAP
jgi:hypothetical protein